MSPKGPHLTPLSESARLSLFITVFGIIDTANMGPSSGCTGNQGRPGSVCEWTPLYRYSQCRCADGSLACPNLSPPHYSRDLAHYPCYPEMAQALATVGGIIDRENMGAHLLGGMYKSTTCGDRRCCSADPLMMHNFKTIYHYPFCTPNQPHLPRTCMR
jgi:hypothetical protein